MRSFRDMDTLIQFMDGYLVYYNYFKPNESLNGKTPAEAAKVDYQIKNWKDLSQMPVSKETSVHKRTEPTTPEYTPPKIGSPRQSSGTILSSSGRSHKPPRITPKPKRISGEVDLGSGISFNRITGKRHLRLT